LEDYTKALSLTADEDRRNLLKERISALERRIKGPQADAVSRITRLDGIVSYTTTPANLKESKELQDAVPVERHPALPVGPTSSGHSTRVQ
jgi:hypothetical protein